MTASREKDILSNLRAVSHNIGGMHWTRLFRAFDKDHSGVLDFGQFKTFLRYRANIPVSVLPESDVSRMFSWLDMSNDGVIVISDFIQWLHSGEQNDGRRSIDGGGNRPDGRGGGRHIGRRHEDEDGYNDESDYGNEDGNEDGNDPRHGTDNHPHETSEDYDTIAFGRSTHYNNGKIVPTNAKHPSPQDSFYVEELTNSRRMDNERDPHPSQMDQLWRHEHSNDEKYEQESNNNDEQYDNGSMGYSSAGEDHYLRQDQYSVSEYSDRGEEPPHPQQQPQQPQQHGRGKQCQHTMGPVQHCQCSFAYIGCDSGITNDGCHYRGCH